MLAVCAFLAFAVVGSVGYVRQRLSGHADDRACSALVPETTAHLHSFETRYRPVGYVYGEGMGYCDPAAPVARFEFRGMYRPRETIALYFQRLEDALARDGWRLAPQHGSTSRVATFASGKTTLTAQIVSTGLYMTPEIVDLNVHANPRLPDAATALPEKGPTKIEADGLMQFTMFYPRALPRGWRVDDSMQAKVSDYAAREYVVFDDAGRASRVVERSAPLPTRTLCASFGNVNQNLKDPTYDCRRIGTANGAAVYLFPHRESRYDEYGTLVDDAAITMGLARRNLPALDRDEALTFFTSLRPTNLAHKRS